jgi:hypothetical protein
MKAAGADGGKPGAGTPRKVPIKNNMP